MGNHFEKMEIKYAVDLAEAADRVVSIYNDRIKGYGGFTPRKLNLELFNDDSPLAKAMIAKLHEIGYEHGNGFEGSMGPWIVDTRDTASMMMFTSLQFTFPDLFHKEADCDIGCLIHNGINAELNACYELLNYIREVDSLQNKNFIGLVGDSRWMTDLSRSLIAKGYAVTRCKGDMPGINYAIGHCDIVIVERAMTNHEIVTENCLYIDPYGVLKPHRPEDEELYKERVFSGLDKITHCILMQRLVRYYVNAKRK